jgi:hypothetical protein
LAFVVEPFAVELDLAVDFVVLILGGAAVYRCAKYYVSDGGVGRSGSDGFQ